MEDATVHGYNNARLIVQGRSSVTAHDQTLVVTHPPVEKLSKLLQTWTDVTESEVS
jgi:hypothetical protein